MMWPKTCPRCHGDLVLEIDLDGPFVGCIQCGRTLNESQLRALLGVSGLPGQKLEFAPARVDPGARRRVA
jgi:hypothetical protein